MHAWGTSSRTVLFASTTVYSLTKSLLFITPAWKRFELTRLCLWQRRIACDTLATHGVDATCVVIANDKNLSIAREFGFETINAPNDYLSRRFNDGYQYAGENAFDYVCPIGSDSWIDPRLLTVLPRPDVMQISRHYALVREDGEAITPLRLQGRYGFACFVLPTRMLEQRSYRPCPEDLQSGCDGALFRGFKQLFVIRRELGPLDIVAFRSPIQITPYERLVKRHRGVERPEPWLWLRKRYPAELVDATEALHRERVVA